MLVFINESGDPGFKVEKGASPIFVAAMVIFENSADAFAASERIDASEARRCHKTEFKFNKCSYDIRGKFFECAAHCSFLVRSIVARKEVIYSTRLRSGKDSFYEYFVKSMMKYDDGILKGAKGIIDGS